MPIGVEISTHRNCGGDVKIWEGTIDGKFVVACRCLQCGTIGPQYFTNGQHREKQIENAVLLWNDHNAE